MPSTSRRSFLVRSGACVTGSVASLALGACGGSDDDRAVASAPPTSQEQQAFTANEALDAIRTGRVTAEAYVTTVLARADALADLHALISIDRTGALAAARAVDARRASGATLPPLAGLPIVVKDNINTANLPTTGGTPALQALRPTANAPSLQKLVDAGAIVIGKANLHELAFGITSTNLAPFAGPVHNPYDRNRIPGGSSGGTAAAIAARIVPAGLGTDTGGSTRVPAALCGVVGMRPSVGNGGVQRRYHDENAVVPISHTRDTIGTLGRTVADVALLDAVITGRAVPSAIGLAGLRIGIPATFWAGLESQLAVVVATARARLAASGVVFVDVDLAGIAALNDRISFQIALHEPIADIPAYLAANGASGITLAQLVAGIASPDVKGAFGAILADAYGGQYADAIGVQRPALQALYASYFADNALDALLMPATPLSAVPIDAVHGSSTVSIDGGPPLDEFTTFIRNTDPGSNAGIPGVVVFAGMTTGGLPVGLELDGPVGSDQRLLGIALSLEAVLGHAPAPTL